MKKVNKWNCKVCGQKQSVIKEFGRGSGADCRRHVQKLNAARGAKIEEQDEAKRAKMEAQLHWETTEFDKEEQLQRKPTSRWDKYISARQEEAEVTHEEVEPEEAVVMDRDQLSFRKPRPKRPEPYKKPSGNTKKRPTEKQDISRPQSTSRIPSTTPSIPTTSSNISTPSIPSTSPAGAVSKWSAFLQHPPVSELDSGFSGSSLFQTEDHLDLALNWD